MTAVSSTKGFVFNYVARVDAREITAKEFEKEYVEPRIPCFIDNLIESWPAYSLWTKDYFLTQHRETMIYTNEVGDEHCLKGLSDPKNWMGLGHFIEELDRGGNRLHFSRSHPATDILNYKSGLLDQIELGTIERIMPRNKFLGREATDWDAYPIIPPYSPNIFIGGAGLSALPHYDPDTSHTFHWCVFGKKSVKMIDYERVKGIELPLMKIHYDDMLETLPDSLLRQLPQLDGMPAWHADLEPGDVLFMPSMNWHAFKYHDTSLATVLRYRSFSSLEGYLDFVAGVQTPLTMIDFHSSLYRQFPESQTHLFHRLLAAFPSIVSLFVSGMLKLMRLIVRLRGHRSS